MISFVLKTAIFFQFLSIYTGAFQINIENVRSTIQKGSKEPIETVSKLRSLKFIQLTRQTEPALLADYLMEIGASSVSITDHDAETEKEDPIFLEPDNSDIFAAIVCGDAAVGKNIWLRCDVTAHFTESFDPLDIVDNVRTAFDLGISPRFEVDEVPDLVSSVLRLCVFY